MCATKLWNVLVGSARDELVVKDSEADDGGKNDQRQDGPPHGDYAYMNSCAEAYMWHCGYKGCHWPHVARERRSARRSGIAVSPSRLSAPAPSPSAEGRAGPADYALPLCAQSPPYMVSCVCVSPGSDHGSGACVGAQLCHASRFPLETLGPVGGIFAHGGNIAYNRMQSWLQLGRPTVMLFNTGGVTQAFASLHDAVVRRHEQELPSAPRARRVGPHARTC